MHAQMLSFFGKGTAVSGQEHYKGLQPSAARCFLRASLVSNSAKSVSESIWLSSICFALATLSKADSSAIGFDKSLQLHCQSVPRCPLPFDFHQPPVAERNGCQEAAQRGGSLQGSDCTMLLVATLSGQNAGAKKASCHVLKLQQDKLGTWLTEHGISPDACLCFFASAQLLLVPLPNRQSLVFNSPGRSATFRLEGQA